MANVHNVSLGNASSATFSTATVGGGSSSIDGPPKKKHILVKYKEAMVRYQIRMYNRLKKKPEIADCKVATEVARALTYYGPEAMRNGTTLNCETAEEAFHFVQQRVAKNLFHGSQGTLEDIVGAAAYEAMKAEYTARFVYIKAAAEYYLRQYCALKLWESKT